VENLPSVAVNMKEDSLLIRTGVRRKQIQELSVRDKQLLGQEPYLNRAISQARILLTLVALPLVLYGIAFLLVVVSTFGATDQLDFLSSEFQEMWELFDSAKPASVLISVLIFAWYLECRLKLQHIASLKELTDNPSSQQCVGE
jgi:hypothetical protein